MRRVFLLTLLVSFAGMFSLSCQRDSNPLGATSSDGPMLAQAGKGAAKKLCTSIQDGLFASNGDPIVLGYDQYGYNYQSHMFKGRYCDSDRVEGGDYCDVKLIMKWNDAWMSNMDCDRDGKLDRHSGFASYIGSGAWETNHQSGEYELDGELVKWSYFVKIIAVPADATKSGGIWYDADGIEIGPDLWGQFAIIQQISNDPGLGEHGVYYKSPVGPGFGKYKP